MENRGYAPSSVTYNVIVRSLLRRNELDMAIPFLEEIPQRGFSADATTFALLINRLQGRTIGDFLLKLIKNVLSKEVVSESIWSYTSTLTFSPNKWSSLSKNLIILPCHIVGFQGTREYRQIQIGGGFERKFHK